jgi:inhibitor of KinA sporulation pathway (predicted exonuclease)
MTISRPYGNIVIFDLELTAWPGSMERDWKGENEHREVIQIGAVKADAGNDLIEVGQFQVLIRPLINPVLSDYIMALTGIRQDDIEQSGVSFEEALDQFHAFAGNDTAAICCNGIDATVLDENCKINSISNRFQNSNFVNLKPLFLKALQGVSTNPISGDLATLFGLSSEHQKHDALGDSLTILAALRHLRQNGTPLLGLI